MFNRTTDALSNSRTASPALEMLDPEQRMRLAKSSQKVGKVLGATPVLDVIPPSPESVIPPPSPKEDKTSKSSARRTHFLATLRSPKSRTRPAQLSVRDDPFRAPVLRYKIAPVEYEHETTRFVTTVKASHKGRKAIPSYLNLMEPVRYSSTSTLSSLRHSVFSAYNHSPIIFLSPLSPLSPISPFSPTSAEQAQQDKLEGLQRLARMSRCIGGNAPLELVLPSLVQAGERAIWVKSYLDLYRMALTDDISVTATTRRTSRGTRRRSQSVGNLASWAETENRPATSHTVPMSAASTMLPYLKPLTSADVAADPSLAPYLALPSSRHTTYEPLEDPLQHQQFIAHAKAAILGADAVLMASFRQNFPPRSLEHVLAVCPLPSPPVPSPLAAVRSPRVPYWVKTSFRPRASTAHPYGHARRRKSRASVWPPATPSTMRRERRQGWGGEWNQDLIVGLSHV